MSTSVTWRTPGDGDDFAGRRFARPRWLASAVRQTGGQGYGQPEGVSAFNRSVDGARARRPRPLRTCRRACSRPSGASRTCGRPRSPTFPRGGAGTGRAPGAPAPRSPSCGSPTSRRPIGRCSRASPRSSRSRLGDTSARRARSTRSCARRKRPRTRRSTSRGSGRRPAATRWAAAPASCCPAAAAWWTPASASRASSASGCGSGRSRFNTRAGRPRSARTCCRTSSGW